MVVGLPGCELLPKHYTTLKFKSQVLAKMTGNENNTLGSSIVELATELFSSNYGAQQSDIGRLRSTWLKTYLVESGPVAIFFLLLVQRHEDTSYLHIRKTAKLHVVQPTWVDMAFKQCWGKRVTVESSILGSVSELLVVAERAALFPGFCRYLFKSPGCHKAPRRRQ